MTIEVEAINLTDLIRKAAGDRPREAEPIREAQVAELRELAANYWRCLPRSVIDDMQYSVDAACPNFPFRLGDLVTPKAGSPLAGNGRPHIVVEVHPDAKPFMSADEGYTAASFGERLQLRVMTWNNGRYVCFWNAAYMHEPYTGEGADVAPAA